MRLDSPFEWIPSQWLWPIWLGLMLATLAVGHLLKGQVELLERVLPNGMLDIEAPWSQAHAKAVRNALQEPGIEAARRQTMTDFLFLVLYPLAISLSCVLIAAGLPGKIGALGMMIAWGSLLAGPLDAIENVCMLRLLSGFTTSPWPQISTICAVVKFTLIAGGLGFSLVGLLLRIVNSLRL